MKWLLISVFAFFGVHTALWAASTFLRRERDKSSRSDDNSDNGAGSH
jgi:hypothetical protein